MVTLWNEGSCSKADPVPVMYYSLTHTANKEQRKDKKINNKMTSKEI